MGLQGLFLDGCPTGPSSTYNDDVVLYFLTKPVELLDYLDSFHRGRVGIERGVMEIEPLRMNRN